MSWTQPKAGCETNFGVHLILGTNLCPSNVVNSFIPTTLHMPLTGLKKKRKFRLHEILFIQAFSHLFEHYNLHSKSVLNCSCDKKPPKHWCID